VVGPYSPIVLARIAAVACRPVLNEENLVPCWGDLQAKTFEVFIPPDLVATGRGGEGIDDALRELASGHDGWGSFLATWVANR
jgi:hypothetical protein